jgi:hypothetical protein
VVSVSSNINIATIAHGEEWLSYHLRRWLWQAQKTNPDANYYLVIPYLPGQRAGACTWKKRLAKHFSGIVLTEHVQIPGRLAYYERLRAHTLEAFGIPEALYTDVDVDILTNLDHLRDLYPRANMLWVPNAIYPPDVRAALVAYKLSTAAPISDPGWLYMRRSYAKEFENVRLAGKIPMNTYVPCSGVWNVVMRQAGDTMSIPYSYNTVYWEHKLLANAKVIHFPSARGKEERKWYDLSEMPHKLEIRLHEYVEPALRW